MHSRMKYAYLGAALGLVLSACGAGQRSAKGGNAPDSTAAAAAAAVPAEACGLISLQEVQAVTGLRLVPGPTSQDLRGYSECEWSLTPGRTDGVIVVVNREGKFEDYSSVPGSEPVRGFGLAASWNPTVRQMAVKRDTGTVSVSFLPDSAQKRWAEKIMRTVLKRLSAGAATKAGAPGPVDSTAAQGNASSTAR